MSSLTQSLLSLIEAAFWPATVLILAFGFRKPVAELIQRITAIRAPGVELEAEARANAAAAVATAVAESVAAKDASPSVESAAKLNHLRALADVQPTTAILQGYETLESVLRRILEAANLADDQSHLPPASVRKAAAHGLVEESSIAAVDGLAVMRDLVAHGGSAQVSTRDAHSYISLVTAAIYAITHPRRPS